MSIRTPVALFIFRRPQTTAQVMAAIRQAQPPLLLVVADGPRTDHPDDITACAAARQAAEAIDWPCELRTCYADHNLGLRKRMASGLDWVFEQVEQAIILEDDCVVDASFFPLCDELLPRFAGDERIKLISAKSNLQQPIPHSYYFSRYGHIWGWASWRRAWEQYDADMVEWPELREAGWLNTVLDDQKAVRHWTKIFDRVYSNQISTWDYQTKYACWRHNGLNIIPSRNLVLNVGIGADATNTFSARPGLELDAKSLDFPLTHPPAIMRNVDADLYTQREIYETSFWVKVREKIAYELRRWRGQA